ncbi:MAG: M20/M25/M40 family metallo-hydrolase, partial [Gammaproteobacteria bacterium]
MLSGRFFPRNAVFLPAVGVLAVLVALSALGLYHASPPSPLPVDAPPAFFSAARAMSHVRRIAQHPHPVGTVENAEARDYLIGELRALGLEPQVQTALGVHAAPEGGRVGVVRNVLVKIPGRKAGKALLLSAHYDSTHAGPGAADNAASVAAVLETLRALKHAPPLQNDLICLFSDGEEAGLLGAEAFVSSHPWATAVGLVLNFEYRGNAGASLMFETSRGNGRLIDGFAEAVANPLGSSLMVEIYKRLPNDTDLTVFKRAGLSGMNFAAIEGHSAYHTRLDRPDALHPESLQHQGEIMLALAGHFGRTPLDD